MSLAALKTWMVGGERGGSLQPAGIVRVSSLLAEHADWNQAGKHLAQHQPHAWKRLLNGLLVRARRVCEECSGVGFPVEGIQGSG